MALYAFDGTWNLDHEDEDLRDTNVVRFGELYAGTTEYRAGVGTRFRRLGRFAGGVFGAGGRRRIQEMREELAENWGLGDHVVDVIGFSRGAALALHFANGLAESGLEVKGETIHPRVRFLGLWDVVASFGLSFDTFVDFQSINLGWDIDRVAANVDHCFHALALDERRETFEMTRLDPENCHDHIVETWFRGVHSDIGGGNENPKRSNIALQWMLERALGCGLPIKENRARDPRYAEVDPLAPVSENSDPQRDERRVVGPDDDRHESSRSTTLEIGGRQEVVVHSRLRYNWTGLRVDPRQKYRFHVSDGETWKDKEIVCGPGGWTSEDLPWLEKAVVQRLEGRRRVPQARWFQLCGAIDDEEDHLFPVETETDVTIDHAGDLYLFANDLRSLYGNNSGSLTVTVTRTE